MPKDFDFMGTGFKGAGFELKGQQERNLDSLLTILNTKPATDTLTAIAKVDKETWGNIKSTVSDLKGLASGSDLSILSGIGDSITETIKTELNAVTSELQNAINTSINDLLEPFMPAIEVGLNTITSIITTGFSAWTALFTGKWADFEARIEELFPGITQAREDFRVEWSEFLVEFGLQFDPELYLLIQEMNAAGTAGGVYSGQFNDLNYETVTNAIANLNLNLPDYTEEE